MQAKQKVTLYLSPELHRRLKIRAAIDAEPMSELAERAIVFYMEHPEVVDEVEAYYGLTHRVIKCPECAISAVMRDGEMVPLSSQPGVMEQEQLSVEQVSHSATAQQGEEEMILVSAQK